LSALSYIKSSMLSSGLPKLFGIVLEETVSNWNLGDVYVFIAFAINFYFYASSSSYVIIGILYLLISFISTFKSSKVFIGGPLTIPPIA